ncbi:MAG: DUF6065 family protein [Pseudomonadota bacterium]
MGQPGKADGAVVQLWKAYAAAPDIHKADKSAAGTMPAGAFQYCEPMRVASGFGWYVYPPKDISLYFDGREIYFYEEDQWFPIKSTPFEGEFQTAWNAVAPKDLEGHNPPFITELFVPGAMQMWSGYFMRTAPGWSMLVRSPVNYDARSSISHFEGIIETSSFQPCPVFSNFRIVKTDTEIFLARDKPLFQIQPIPRAAYLEGDRNISISQGLAGDDADFDWSALSDVMRRTATRDLRRPGRYATHQRKAAKEDGV